ncbi:hypothetical protein BC830DRAFT_1115195 [Chytriomyces sp. MP71]|nr:hypothetical protein BC830DRAFT_1115195 [Chytriomyces sp. MP71]
MATRTSKMVGDANAVGTVSEGSDAVEVGCAETSGRAAEGGGGGGEADVTEKRNFCPALQSAPESSVLTIKKVPVRGSVNWYEALPMDASGRPTAAIEAEMPAHELYTACVVPTTVWPWSAKESCVATHGHVSISASRRTRAALTVSPTTGVPGRPVKGPSSAGAECRSASAANGARRGLAAASPTMSYVVAETGGSASASSAYNSSISAFFIRAQASDTKMRTGVECLDESSGHRVSTKKEGRGRAGQKARRFHGTIF